MTTRLISLCSRTLVASLTLTLSSAQSLETLPFPGTLLSLGEQGQALEFQSDLALIAALPGLDRVSLVGVPMPNGMTLTLDLEQVAFQWQDLGVYVDGTLAEYNRQDLTFWKGKVRGVGESDVFLSFSSYGSYGWINDGVDYSHLSSMPNSDGDWAGANMRLCSGAALAEAGMKHETAGADTCLFDQVNNRTSGTSGSGATGFDPPIYGAAQKLECRVAIETDNQLYNIFSSLQACQNYVFTLLAAVSDRFDTQIDVVLTFPYVQFWTITNDPWISQDKGLEAAALLSEFQNAWAGQFPKGAHLAHFLSGANLGGGRAMGGPICSQLTGFSVCGSINGNVNFPVSQGSTTWDFVGTAHELGHNFGTIHTHNYCPPLDKCATNCTLTTSCSSKGTIMSYCHTCNDNGVNNITTFFHPKVCGVMRFNAVMSCIPKWNGGGYKTLFGDIFEYGSLKSNGWSKSDTVLRPGMAQKGFRVARIREGGFLCRSVDTTGFSDVLVRYWRKTRGYDGGEVLRFEISTNGGSIWKLMGATANESWGVVEYLLPISAGNCDNLLIRFRSYGGDSNLEYGEIDNVGVYGR